MANEKKPKTSAEVLGRMLQHLREDAELTQETVAQELGLSGPSIVSRIETGAREIKLWQFVKACELYGEDPRKIFDQYLAKLKK